MLRTRREPVVVADRQPHVDGVRLVLNIVWLVLHGWLLALAYLLAGAVACLLIVTIPFGIASFRLAAFAAWPFGRTTVRAAGAGVASALGNVLWFLFAGWWLALLHVVAGIAYCMTIIGIPFGIALFKLAVVGLFPLGKRVVSTDMPATWRGVGATVDRSPVR
jgi:uncharacterized membrane protein YccF (DUF307 family)